MLHSIWWPKMPRSSQSKACGAGRSEQADDLPVVADKGDILLESLAARAEAQISTSDHGSYEEDLLHFLNQTFKLLRPQGVRRALRSLMAEAQQNPDLLLRFREEFLERRRAALFQIVSRAEGRGDLPATVRGELIGDVVFGVIWYRMLSTERLLGIADAQNLAGLLASNG